jgi:hypothetical protein
VVSLLRLVDLVRTRLGHCSREVDDVNAQNAKNAKNAILFLAATRTRSLFLYKILANYSKIRK